MDFYGNFFGTLCILLNIISNSQQNVHVGVDLVTKLNNDLIQMIFKEASTHKENILMSPFGLLSNLAMILEGSSEKTRQELLQALTLSSKDVGNLRKGFKAYCELFLKYSNEPEAAGSFTSASLSSSFRLNSTYRGVLETYYCANVSRLTSKESTLELSSVTGVMSHWKDYEKLAVYTFLSHQSVQPFAKREGSPVLVPMIPQVGLFKSFRWENARVLLLPLQAKLVELLLIIPDKMEEADALLKKLSEVTIPVLVQSSPKEEVEAFIPQMAIVSKNLNVTSVLVRNGIHRIFDSQKSDLSKTSSTNEGKIHVGKLEQNAFFSTSFVALNSVSGISASLERRRSKREARKYYADRPFFFFVIQKDTQLVLLAGKVEDPIQVPNSKQ